MLKNLLITFNLLNIFMLLMHYCCAFQIETVKLELLDDKFRVSITNDPNIRWIAYNININKEFRAFEAGQLTGLVTFPERGLWSYEFPRNLNDNDLVYIWLGIQYNNIVFRDTQGPFSVAAIRRGDRNVIASSPSKSTSDHLGTNMLTSSSSSSSSTTTTTTTTTTPKATNVEKFCFATVTETSTRDKFCKGDLLFEEVFQRSLSNRWINEIRIPLDTGDSEFVVYNGTAHVENNALKLPAELYTRNIVRGTLDLDNRCTSFNYKECRLEAKGSFFLPPVRSSRVSTRKSFSFKYGRIEVKAKLPKGDWLVPLISLEPTTPKYGLSHYINGEIRIAFARGNHELKSDNEEIGGQRLYGGLIFSSNADMRHQFMVNVTLDDVNGSKEHFGNQYHLYSMIWKPNEILFSVDGYQYGKIKTDFKNTLNEMAWRYGENDAPLDQMFHINLGLSVGGHGDFPNHCENKPWTNGSPRAILEFFKKSSEWSPTWEQPELDVEFVKVFAV